MKTLKFIYQLLFITICISVGLAAYSVAKADCTTETKIISHIIYSVLLIIPTGFGYWWMIDQLKEKQ
jgi:hypothetical protein